MPAPGDLLRRGLEQFHVQRQQRLHTAVVVGHHRYKDRGLGQTAHRLHLGQMLVVQQSGRSCGGCPGPCPGPGPHSRRSCSCRRRSIPSGWSARRIVGRHQPHLDGGGQPAPQSRWRGSRGRLPGPLPQCAPAGPPARAGRRPSRGGAVGGRGIQHPNRVGDEGDDFPGCPASGRQRKVRSDWAMTAARASRLLRSASGMVSSSSSGRPDRRSRMRRPVGPGRNRPQRFYRFS